MYGRQARLRSRWPRLGTDCSTVRDDLSRLLLETKSTAEGGVHGRLQSRSANARIAFCRRSPCARVPADLTRIHRDRINQRTRDSVAGNSSSDELIAEQIASRSCQRLDQSIAEASRSASRSVVEPQNMSGGETISERDCQVHRAVDPGHACVRSTAASTSKRETRSQQAKLGSRSKRPQLAVTGTPASIASAGEVETFLGARPAIDMTGANRGYKTAFESSRPGRQRDFGADHPRALRSRAEGPVHRQFERTDTRTITVARARYRRRAGRIDGPKPTR